MKKVLSLAIVMILLIVMLTGCMDINYEVTINKDGTADISYVYGFEKSYLEQMETTGEEMTKEMQQSAEAEEYIIEAYSDDKVEGFRATKHIEDLSKISLEEAFGEENVKDSAENQIKVEKKGLKTVYSQKTDIDLTSMESSMAAYVNMKYTVKIPVKVGKNNADVVSEDGKTLTWNLKAGEIKNIQFEGTELGTTAKIIKTVIIVAIIIIAIILVTIIIKAIIKKAKNKNKEEETNKNDVTDNKNHEIVETETVKEQTTEEKEIEEKHETKEPESKNEKDNKEE